MHISFKPLWRLVIDHGGSEYFGDHFIIFRVGDEFISLLFQPNGKQPYRLSGSFLVGPIPFSKLRRLKIFLEECEKKPWLMKVLRLLFTCNWKAAAAFLGAMLQRRLLLLEDLVPMLKWVAKHTLESEASLYKLKRLEEAVELIEKNVKPLSDISTAMLQDVKRGILARRLTQRDLEVARSW